MDNANEIYKRFLNGDNGAFDEILVMYRQSLTFFINRYVRDIHQAEDLAIDSFMYIFVHRRRFNFKVSLKTYLFMIGRSRALDYLKRTKRLERMEEDSESALEYSQIEQAVIESERKKALNNALSELSNDMSIAVHLVYFEELSYDEAAKVMKKSRKQIDNLLYRAKKKLKELLREEGEFDEN